PRQSRVEDARCPAPRRLARVRRRLGTPRRPGRREPDEAGQAPDGGAGGARTAVPGGERRTNRAIHPTAGLLLLDYTNLWLNQGLGIRIVAFSPADERTRRGAEALHRSLQLVA